MGRKKKVGTPSASSAFGFLDEVKVEFPFTLIPLLSFRSKLDGIAGTG